MLPRHFRHQIGDPDQGLAESDVVVDRTFTLPMVPQGYIELHNATAFWDEEDRITIWSSTQGAFGVRSQTAGILKVDESRVKVNPVEIGGGFGGKTVVYLPPVAAVLSRKTHRPVKMIMDRRSVFEGSGPAPGGKIRVRMGVTNEGKIRAADADIRFEAGAFPGSAVTAGAICILACYNIPDVRIDGRDVVINKPKSAAYRAPGSPQVAFAAEQVVDEICDKMGWDKIQFRLDNASQEGTRRADGPAFARVGLVETLEAARSSDHWNSPLEGSGADGNLLGRGIASGYWMNGGGKSTCDLAVTDDGIVFMNEGSADIGGTRASIAMQAAEVLGVGAHDVRPSIPDTDSIGFTGVTGGSRTTYATGYAAYEAAMQLIEKMKLRAAMVWGIDVEDVEFSDGQFSSISDPELRLGFKDLAQRLGGTGGPVTSTASVDLAEAGNSFAVHICDLEVDPQTGKTDVVSLYGDSGRWQGGTPVLRGRAVAGRRGTGHRLDAERGVLHDRGRGDDQLLVPGLPDAYVARLADDRYDPRRSGESAAPVRCSRRGRGAACAAARRGFQCGCRCHRHTIRRRADQPWQDRGRHGRWKRIVEPERLHGPGFHTIQPA